MVQWQDWHSKAERTFLPLPMLFLFLVRRRITEKPMRPSDISQVENRGIYSSFNEMSTVSSGVQEKQFSSRLKRETSSWMRGFGEPWLIRHVFLCIERHSGSRAGRTTSRKSCHFTRRSTERERNHVLLEKVFLSAFRFQLITVGLTLCDAEMQSSGNTRVSYGDQQHRIDDLRENLKVIR